MTWERGYTEAEKMGKAWEQKVQQENKDMYVWQSRVEIKDYSVVFIRSAVTQNFSQGWSSYVLCKRVKYS